MASGSWVLGVIGEKAREAVQRYMRKSIIMPSLLEEGALNHLQLPKYETVSIDS